MTVCYEFTRHMYFKGSLDASVSSCWLLQLQDLLTVFLSSPSIPLLLSTPPLLLFFLLVHSSVCSFPFVSSSLFLSPLLNWVLSFFPESSLLLHQIFKRFLVSTSLTPMPHYRPMARTVGFSPPPPPLCVSLALTSLSSIHLPVLCLSGLTLSCVFLVCLLLKVVHVLLFFHTILFT